MNFFRTHLLRFLLPVALTLLGAIACAVLVPAEIEAVRQQLVGFPDSDVQAHLARPWVLGGLCFLPALAGFAYSLGGTLDRYIAREFFGIFCVCLASLLTIWFLMDLGDKIGDFRKSNHVFHTILVFYGTRSPAVLLLLLPYSLLLALLYSLGKLSGTREVIAMIQAGRSIIRLTLPLIIAGLFFSCLSLGLNYHWAPIAEGNVDAILEAASDKPAATAKAADKQSADETPPVETGDKQIAKARQVLYQNPSQHRLWEIGVFPLNYHKGEPLREVEITTTRADKTLESRIIAKSATWDKMTHQWTFDQAIIAKYQPDMPPIFETLTKPLVISNWTETPWQLVKPGLSAAYLGIPDLNSWLKENERLGQFAEPAPYLTQWHYRWALPFACMVTVLLATPLAIHFSRRGPGGGIFLAVVLSALMLLFSSISLAIGEAGTMRPGVAAWLPNAAFALLGLYLFRRRITGKPIYLILRRLFPGND
jgi:LPS export ABC transporter permease LptG